MKTVQLYNGDVTLEFNDVKHVYTWKEIGKPVRGATSVLKWLNKPALIQWAANMACQEMERELIDYFNVCQGIPTDGEVRDLCGKAKTAHRRKASEAADIGTEVHKFAELTLAGQSPDMPEDQNARKGCGAFLEWLDAHKIEPIHLEHMLFSKKHYFAGTCDFYGRIDGKLCALDFKTSSGIYPEMIIQVNGAYALALEEMYGERIEESWIVRLDKKTGKFEAKRIPRSDEDQTAFRVLLEVDYHMKRLDEKVKELRK